MACGSIPTPQVSRKHLAVRFASYDARANTQRLMIHCMVGGTVKPYTWGLPEISDSVEKSPKSMKIIENHRKSMKIIENQ